METPGAQVDTSKVAPEIGISPPKTWLWPVGIGMLAVEMGTLLSTFGKISLSAAVVLGGGAVAVGGIVMGATGLRRHADHLAAQKEHDLETQELVIKQIPFGPIPNIFREGPEVSKPDPVVLHQAANLVARLHRERS